MKLLRDGHPQSFCQLLPKQLRVAAAVVGYCKRPLSCMLLLPACMRPGTCLMVTGAMMNGALITWASGSLNVSRLKIQPVPDWLPCCCWLAAITHCACRDQLLLDQPDWDFDAFMSSHLDDYLVMSHQFMEEYFAEQQQ